MLDFAGIVSDLQAAYVSDTTPWVIGYSGGKDSTTLLQLVFRALSALPPDKLQKEVHVVSNDTMVENPAIREYVDVQLTGIERAGKQNIFAHAPDLFSVAKVKPSLQDRFWVNLIGKGYPSPNHWFRWCTDRLKIRPTNGYIRETVSKRGKVIIVLGTRKAESSRRAASMSAREKDGRFRQHTLPNALVYAPISELSNNDVWAYLLQAANPWGSNNRDLLKLYGSACSAGECPFVIETGTQSCGKSRFGCWVCTVVERDRAMENFVANGYDWMLRLLQFRNWLSDIRQQEHQHLPEALARDQLKFGPFLLKARREILRRLLEVQAGVPIELISAKELRCVRKMLEHASHNQRGNALTKSTVELPTGRRLVVFSDFDITNTDRTRLGPFVLNGAKMVHTETLPAAFSGLTRLMYHTG